MTKIVCKWTFSQSAAWLIIHSYIFSLMIQQNLELMLPSYRGFIIWLICAINNPGHSSEYIQRSRVCTQLPPLLYLTRALPTCAALLSDKNLNQRNMGKHFPVAPAPRIWKSPIKAPNQTKTHSRKCWLFSISSCMIYKPSSLRPTLTDTVLSKQTTSSVSLTCVFWKSAFYTAVTSMKIKGNDEMLQ